MAVTDYKFAGTAATVDRDGGYLWANPNNAKVDNDTRAGNSPDKNDYGDWLRLTNFGFTTDDLPNGSEINGVEVIIDRYTNFSAEGDNRIDSAIYLRDTSGQVGSNKASATNWPTSETNATYGGVSDMWSTTLIDTDIRNSSFGIDLSVFNDTSNLTRFAYVDYIKIRIHYGFPWFSKISGVALADISKINGVAIADVLKVGGVTIPE